MENNKLIAEFIGHEPIVKGDDVYYELNHIRLTSADDLRYHTSWDWLMPVVEKIGDENLLSIDIDRVYDRVVEFIKECNDGYND